MAAIAAGVTGVVLIALVSWQLSGGGWWAVAAVRLTAWLAVGKVGFKVALAAMLGVIALAAWLRGRRRGSGREPVGDPGSPDGDA
jgi:hypothetical protein